MMSERSMLSSSSSSSRLTSCSAKVIWCSSASLRLVLHDIELLTGLGNLCLLIFQIAFIATTLCFFLTLALLEVANGGGMCGQLTLDTADAARRRFERGADLSDLNVELL